MIDRGCPILGFRAIKIIIRSRSGRTLRGITEGPTDTLRLADCSVFVLFVHCLSERVHSEGVLLDVVEHEGKALGLLTVVDDGDGRGALDLAGGALLVVLAVAEPLTELGAVLNLDHGDVVGLGEGVDELEVLGVIAVLSEDAANSLLAVEGLADLVESLDET